MTELERYAELLVVHGLNVQKGQLVNIVTEAIHRDFAMMITERCYRRGARFVHLELTDPRSTRLRVLHSAEEDLTAVPAFYEARYRELVDVQAANLKIIGSEDPDILADLPPEKVNTVGHNLRLAMKYFLEEGIGKSKVHWTVAAAATPKWGENVFPDLEGEEACDRLWQAIFSVCRVDKSDCLALWAAHNDVLQRRAVRLNELNIREIRFVGPGTDLTVGLSPRAIFKGGQDLSTRGEAFEPNLPTEEVFTTPDFRQTNGKVRTTRPFMINGKLIEDLEVEFTGGVITGFEASEGAETFEAYSNSDEGGKRLGEVALVGIDSPVYESGIVFQEILFDENAACHIAIGSAYKFCLEGGDSLTSEEAAEIGCNESVVHTDMMISSEEVDVTAISDGGEIPLLKGGRWTGDFAL